MAIVIFFIFLILIFPLIITAYLLVDIKNKKVFFAIFLFGKIKVLSGYINKRNKGGFYIHLSNNKAVIIDKNALLKLKGGPNFFKNFDAVNLKFIIDTGVSNGNVIFLTVLLKRIIDSFLLTFGFNKNYKNLTSQINIYNENDTILYLKLKLCLVFNLICILKSLFANYISEVKNVKKKFKQLKS